MSQLANQGESAATLPPAAGRLGLFSHLFLELSNKAIIMFAALDFFLHVSVQRPLRGETLLPRALSGGMVAVGSQITNLCFLPLALRLAEWLQLGLPMVVLRALGKSTRTSGRPLGWMISVTPPSGSLADGKFAPSGFALR